MQTSTDTPELKKSEPAQPRPYVKPAVERIPLSAARSSSIRGILQGDLGTVVS